MATIITFKPKLITKKLLSELGNDRVKDILLSRFGIGDSAKRKTLESIGQHYGITRERVRQLENFALNSLRQGKGMSEIEDALKEIREYIATRGGILSESDILEDLSDSMESKNHINFFLVLGDDFIRLKENENFVHRWAVDEEKAKKIEDILLRLHGEVSVDDLIQEKELISKIQNHAKETLNEKIKEEIIKSWLNISKLISRNVLGDWGHVYSENISPRGVRDLAFLVFRKQGSPMHFNEVSKSIGSIFTKKAHPATVHNELIKDPRFVLVGRGIYALKDWGYSPGTVRDIIKNILKSQGPLTKDEIIKRVLKERYVKENTILVNLQDNKHFKRNKDGTYRVA